jgi:hypothetical protein
MPYSESPASQMRTNGRGTGKAFAGHGAIEEGASSLTIPKGTSLTIWGKEGQAITDRAGRLIEQGNFEELINLNGGMIEGAVTHLPGATIPRMVLKPPHGLNIMNNSITVGSDTYINKLLNRNMGNVHWAACLVCQ